MAGNTTISDTYDRVLTATRTRVIPKLFDNITADIPTFYYFRQRERIQRVSTPGFALEFNALKELPSGTGGGTGTQLTPLFLDPYTRGRYAWKNLYVPFKIGIPDMEKNEGELAAFDLVGAHIDAVLAGMTDMIGKAARGVWSTVPDETDEGKVTGIPSMIKSAAADNTTGTLAGISRTNAWWQNQIATAITSFATDGLTRYTNALFLAKRMNEGPDLLLTNNTQLQNYLALFTKTIRFNVPIETRVADQLSVDIGISQTSFYGARVIGDSQAPAGLAYFINTKYLQLYVKDGREMLMSEPLGFITEDSIAFRLASMLNLVCENLGRQAVVSGGDAA